MNERIKEFARQAGFKVNWQHEDIQAIKMAQYEEFAELIIQECLGKISGLIVEETFENLEAIDPWLKWNQALGHAALEIEQHFYGEQE